MAFMPSVSTKFIMLSAFMRMLTIDKLSSIILNDVLPNGVILNDLMLSVVMPSVVILIVVASFWFNVSP